MDISFRGVVCDSADADAIGWGFETPGGPIVKVPFKHPVLEDTDVRIDITYTGLCFSDVFKATGGWGDMGVWPLIPGHEVFGRVVKVGEKVTRVKEGQLVGCGPYRDACFNCKTCLEGLDNHCPETIFKYLYDPHFGGYATSIQLPEKLVFVIPEGMNEKLCPPLLCAGVTVYAPILRYAKPGLVCAVAGIGGLGHLALQYSKKMGMKTIAISQTDSKKELALKLGADLFVNSNDKAQMAKLANEGVDILVNTLYIAEIKPYLELLRTGRGVLIQVGLPQAGSNLQFNAFDIVARQLTIAGSEVGSYKETKEMLEFSAANQIYPIVESFSFEDFPKAFNRLQHERPVFRCVVDVMDRKDWKH